VDRRSVRRSQRRTLDEKQLQRVIALRPEQCTLRRMARLLVLPLSTVGRTLKAMGLGRLKHLQPPVPVRRYLRDPLCRSSAFESGWSWSCCSSWLSCLQGRTPLEGRMRPECVVLPAPAISQELSLGSRGEQLGVEELIPEASVERFYKAVLPWGSWLDVGRAGGVAGLSPIP
jgi:hypothetical protein